MTMAASVAVNATFLSHDHLMRNCTSTFGNKSFPATGENFPAIRKLWYSLVLVGAYIPTHYMCTYI